MNHLLKAAVLAAMVALHAVPASAADMEYHAAFDRWAKVNAFFDTDGAVADWLQCFRPSVGARVQGDEFAAATVRNDSLALMKQEIAATDLKAPLTIRTTANFDQYDFSAKRFSFRPPHEGTFFPATRRNGACEPKTFPSSFKIMIVNPGMVDGLPMLEEKARAFIAARRNGSTTDREVELVLQVKADQLAGDDALNATILGYQVIDVGPQNLGVIYAAPAGTSGAQP